MNDFAKRDPTPATLAGDDARLLWMSKVFMDAQDPILIEDLDGIVIVSTAKDLSAGERLELSGMVEGILQKNASSIDELMAQAHRALARWTPEHARA